MTLSRKRDAFGQPLPSLLTGFRTWYRSWDGLRQPPCMLSVSVRQMRRWQSWSPVSAFQSQLVCPFHIYSTYVCFTLLTSDSVLSGRIGAMLHIPFPIAIRASYGAYFHYFCVVSRAILALFWFGVHSVYGSNCMNAVLTLRNHSPRLEG